MMRALLGTARVATEVLMLVAVATAVAAAAGTSHYQEAHASSAPFQYAQSTVKIHNGSIPALAPNEHDAFGSSVDFVGDVNGDGVPDLAVGASGDDSYAENSGAAYLLFLNADGTAKSATKITGADVPSLRAGDYFGAGVAGIGDVNGDGVPDMAVGADGDDAGGTDAGTVHVLFLDRSGAVISSTELSPNTVPGLSAKQHEYFGFRVAGIGDLDGDGVPDLAVGRYLAHGSLLFLNLPFNFTDTVDERLAAYPDEEFYGSVDIIFMNADGTAKESASVGRGTANAPAIEPGHFFGTAVAGIGDFDGDGVPDLTVGSDSTDLTYTKVCRGSGSSSTTVLNTGSMHVLMMNSDGSVKDSFTIDGATENGPVLGEFEFFGISVSAIGDLDGDGVTELAGGSNRGDGGGLDRGEVHVMYMNRDGSIKATQTLDDLAPNGPSLDDYNFFGFAMSSSTDVNGDGRPDIAVGAYLDNIRGLHDQSAEDADTLTPEEREAIADEISRRAAEAALGAVHIILTS